MRRRLLLLSVLIISLSISGCIDSTTKVTVNGDGSGIITETMGMSKEVIKQMQQMMPTEEGQVLSEDDFFKREDFVEKASEYGQDVKLIDFKTSSNDKSVYAQAVFEFNNVAKIRIKQGDTSGMGGQDSPEDEKFITFNFDMSADNPILKIMIPQDDIAEPDTAAAKPPVATPSAADEAMMKQMFAGMHFAGLIEVNGKITSTNAQHVDGSTVTLFDVEFDKILDRPEILAQLQGTQGPLDVQEIFKGVEGIKLDSNNEIDITFVPGSAAAAAGSLDEAVSSSRISSPMDFSLNSIMPLLGGMALILLIPLVIVVILNVWFFARILRKAGFSPALAFLLLIPGLNGLIGLILLMILAFVDWPVYEKFAALSDQMNDFTDDLVIDEPVVVTEAPEIKLDDTANFSKQEDASNKETGGVPLPGESNHTMGSLDSEKLSQEKSEDANPVSEAPSAPEIILSNGGLTSEEKKEEPPITEELAPQSSSIEPVQPEESEPPKVIEIPDVEAPKDDVLEPEKPSMPESNESDLKLPDAPDDTPKLPTEDEDEADKDKPVI